MRREPGAAAARPSPAPGPGDGSSAGRCRNWLRIRSRSTAWTPTPTPTVGPGIASTGVVSTERGGGSGAPTVDLQPVELGAGGRPTRATTDPGRGEAP